MNSIKHLEYHQCRACYDSTNNLQLLTSYAENDDQADAKTYGQLLAEICNINIVEDKPLGQWPQFICFDCSNKLKLANDFIQQTNKINRFLKAVADLLKPKNGTDQGLFIELGADFFQKPELDIPLEVKIEKDDDVEILSIERAFQYSPIESEVLKSTRTDENPSFNHHAFKEYANNEMLENDHGCIKDIIEPSTIEFVNNELIIKDDLNKSHSEKETDIKSKQSAKNSNALCTLCNKLYSNIWNLRRHVRLNHGSQEQKNFCSSIKRHKRNVHKIKNRKAKTNRNISTPQAKKGKGRNVASFICNGCNKIFSTYQKLARHERFVHVPEEQKIPCLFCEQKFGRTDNMKSHMERVHSKTISPLGKTKGSRFSCGKCYRSYAHRNSLKYHEKEVHGK